MNQARGGRSSRRRVTVNSGDPSDDEMDNDYDMSDSDIKPRRRLVK